MKNEKKPTSRQYAEARSDAQRRANELGMDHGLEWNALLGHFMIRLLPQRRHRFGHELRCEVVMPEDLSRCKVGHGPGKLPHSGFACDPRGTEREGETMDFGDRTIKVQGQTIKVKTGKGSDFWTSKDISRDMDRVASLIAWWGSVKGAAMQEAETVDAFYRQWRARKALEILERDPKLAEWKVKALIEADPEFARVKAGIAKAQENVEVATVMVRAAEKKANILQSRGANLRAEKRTQGMHTPADEPEEEESDEQDEDDEPEEEENDTAHQKVSTTDHDDGHGLGDDDFSPEWYGKESVSDKTKKLKEAAAKRRQEAKSKGSPEPDPEPPAKKAKKTTKAKKSRHVIDI